MIQQPDNTQELDEILADWEHEVTGTPKHWDKTTDRLAIDTKYKQAILDWHNKQVEEAVREAYEQIIGDDEHLVELKKTNLISAGQWNMVIKSRNSLRELQRKRLDELTPKESE